MPPEAKLARLTRVIVWLALTCPACGSTLLDRGVSQYDAGRYPEALASLTRLQSQGGRIRANEQGRYALYRGLSELALGNACEAYRWLSATKALLERDPRALDRGERGRLGAAWQSLGKMPGEVR